MKFLIGFILTVLYLSSSFGVYSCFEKLSVNLGSDFNPTTEQQKSLLLSFIKKTVPVRKFVPDHNGLERLETLLEDVNIEDPHFEVATKIVYKRLVDVAAWGEYF